MEGPVLRISPKKYSGETTIVSMRLAKDLLKNIDAVSNVTAICLGAYGIAMKVGNGTLLSQENFSLRMK